MQIRQVIDLNFPCEKIYDFYPSQQVEGADSALLLQSDETPPGTLYPGQGPQDKKDMDLLEWAQRRAMKVITELEQLSLKIGGDMGLFSLEKGRFQKNLIAALQYLNGAY